MIVGSNGYEFEWIDEWARIPDTESGRTNGRTHGVEVTEDGRVVVFNQADPAVLCFDQNGTLLESWGSRFHGAHGLTLVAEHGETYCWLTDQDSGEVVKTTLGGETVARLDEPEHAAYEDGTYVPTWVAVHERSTGDRDIWVADGYGESLIHRFDESGGYQDSFDGTTGAGRFDCPHAIFFDSRPSGTGPELYVADRGNARVQVYRPDGSFARSFGTDVLTSPCAFDTYQDFLVVPELFARVTLFDGDDGVITHLGANQEIVDHDDWPNVPEEALAPGRFNSPHDAACDDEGHLYVVEWIKGGRITKLRRV